MKFPNPYTGNYKLLAILPILLVLVSLFFTFIHPQVKAGVDFKGGILVTLQMDQPFDAQTVKSQIESEGFAVNTIKSLQNPSGYKGEIELQRSEKLNRGDELKKKFYLKVDDVSRLEGQVVFTNQSEEAVKKYEEARGELDAVVNEMFEIAGKEKNASAYKTTNMLQTVFLETWREISKSEQESLRKVLAKYIDFNSVSFKEVTPVLSASFADKALGVAIMSAVVAIIVVYIIFRDPIPSAAVLIGATADIIIALGAMAVFDIPLTLASFAALIMLVGYSLDTDIMLTKRVLKRKDGKAHERAYESMKTGLTMSITGMVAFSSLFILASVTHIRIYYEISSVALIGLIGDIIATWMLNAVIVLHYAQELEKKGSSLPTKPLASFIFSR